MTVLLRRAALCLLLALCCAPAAWAGNPRISLKLDDVSGAEAVAALSKASGISLETPEARFDPPGRVAAQLKERGSFNWTDVRFAAALRELCARFNLRPQQRGGGYTLYPSAAPPAVPGKRVGLAEKNGVRLFVRRISISNQREINFDNDQGFGNPGSMNLYLAGEMLDGDAETFAGFTDVAAKDDLGNLVVSEQRLPFGRGAFGPGFGSSLYPDEFSGSVNLPAPHPKARKLLWLEGELLVHKRIRRVIAEVPVPVPPKGGRKEAEGVTVEVARFETEPDDGDDAGTKVAVQARASWPSDSPLTVQGLGTTGTIALRGASGKLYSFASGSGGGGGGGVRMTYNYNLTFHRVTEPITAVVFTLMERSEPEPLLTFRMTDLPLPGESAFVPRRALPPPAPRTVAGAPAPERPFFDAKGGRLANRVLIAAKPAPEGTLSLGLAAREGTEWGPVRWTDVPVSKDGAAALPEVKPGSYRLLRVYRIKEAPEVRTDGVWQNGEVEVEVTAGKETSPPPLVWAPRLEPAARPPKPAARPRPGR